MFGKCLAGEVSVLLLDEPTRGVDVGSKAEIYEIVRDVAKAGAGVLIVSSDFSELLGLSDRVLVLAAGRQLGTEESDQTDGPELLSRCHQVPTK